MKTNFISLQGSYKYLEIAIFKESKCISHIKREGSRASSQLIPYLDDILKESFLSLPDIEFIAVNQGPGASTSLRVVISSANAISFASKIPLIGIDGLEALAFECFKLIKNTPKVLVSLLNAFNNEAFFAVYTISDNNLELQMPKGYKKIDLLLDEIKTKFPKEEILFCGNGTQVFKNQIDGFFSSYARINPELPLICSAEQVGLMALTHWEKKENISTKLLPTYLKIQNYKPKYS